VISIASVETFLGKAGKNGLKRWKVENREKRRQEKEKGTKNREEQGIKEM